MSIEESTIRGPWASMIIGHSFVLARMRADVTPDGALHVETQMNQSGEMVTVSRISLDGLEPGNPWFPLDTPTKLHKFALTFLAKSFATYSEAQMDRVMVAAVGGDRERLNRLLGEVPPESPAASSKTMGMAGFEQAIRGKA